MQTMWIVLIGLIIAAIVLGGFVTGKLGNISHTPSNSQPAPGQTLAQTLFH